MTAPCASCSPICWKNGVEACGRMTGGKKFIRLNSSLEYGVLTITMDNSFDGQARHGGREVPLQ